MNPHTGRLYVGEADIEAAKLRGEHLVELSPDTTAAQMGQIMNRYQRRAARFGDKRQRTYRPGLKKGHR